MILYDNHQDLKESLLTFNSYTFSCEVVSVIGENHYGLEERTTVEACNIIIVMPVIYLHTCINTPSCLCFILCQLRTEATGEGWKWKPNESKILNFCLG